MSAMLVLLLVAASMAVTDLLCTLLVVAEAKGRAWLAGSLDAASDVSRLVYTALGVKAVDGATSRAASTLVVICATSFVATSLTTRWARRMKASEVADAQGPQTGRPQGGASREGA